MTILEINRKVDPVTGCWLWTGHLRKGYGRTSHLGKQIDVHRLAMHLYKNFDLNSGLLVLHEPTCPNKKCFNPDHLYIGTHTDNMQDKSRLKTHCPQGHEYTPENTFRDKTLARRCRKCASKRWRSYYYAKQGLR